MICLVLINYSSPSVTVPHSKNGEIGKNITIPCSISNLTVDTRIKWLKNNVSLNAVNRFNESDRFSGGTFKSPDLTILSAQKEDEGNYICQAQNLDFIGSSQPVHLSLFEDPVVNITNIEPVKEGTNVSISCNVYPAYGVTNITWYKNNSILDIHRHERLGGGTISSPSLMIYFVDENDEGNYTCQATNPVGTDISKPQNVQVLPDIPIVLTSKEETVTIGEYVTLSCNISSVSKLTKVVWYKNNIEFNFNANGTKDNDKFIGGTLQDPSLTIYSVQITDEGNYICNASNAADKTGWSKPVHLSVFEATTESLPSTDIIFSTSELSTPSSDIISTDQIFSTSELSTPSSDIISTDLILSTSDLTTLISNTTSSTFGTTKTSTVPSSVKTTITTTSAKVPSTKSPNSSPTVNMSTTTSSTLSSSKSTTSPSSSKSPSTVMSTVRPTTIHASVSFSSNIPTHTVRSKPSTKISYRSSTVKTSTTSSSTVKTSTTTSPTVKTSTLPSSTSKSPVSTSSANGSTANSENLNAWVITTTVICVVEFIVIVLVVYILWLRKQRRLALQYEKEETVF
ncbi:Hypothetical predicted protein [Mytilus galloprovincialis]|uniref:Ig-like domain-containing protein n=1 Tax=Mytilus galloprovincialis TaxID=29158 RepID=A0A8B6FS97_MYTGA|nr:Hypothetical predicted protein [Mytilus galloprovincialis]